MARTPAYERMLKSMRAFFRLVGRSSEGAHLIEPAGVLDADPAGMTMELAALGAPPDVDYRTGDDLMPIVASINDNAYPFDGTPFGDFTSQHPHGVTSNYVACLDGEPATAVVILPVDGDASVWDVATLNARLGYKSHGALQMWEKRR